MNAAQTLKPPRVLHLSPPTTLTTSATDINSTVWVFIFNRVTGGGHGAVCLAPIHPPTVVLALRIARAPSRENK